MSMGWMDMVGERCVGSAEVAYRGTNLGTGSIVGLSCMKSRDLRVEVESRDREGPRPSN